MAEPICRRITGTGASFLPLYYIKLANLSDLIATELNLSWLDLPDDTGQHQMKQDDTNYVDITNFVPKTFPSRPLLYNVD